MTWVGFMLIALLVYAALFEVAPRVIGWTRRRLGWHTDPLMRRRLQRFREIRLGYGAFILITVAFGSSLFLELYCNSKPLYIRYRDHWQMPALASWGNFCLPWAHFDDQVLAQNFGLHESGELDARKYAAWVSGPERLEEEAARVEAGIHQDETRFRAVLTQQAIAKHLVYNPSAPLPAWKEKDYAAQRAHAQDLRALEADVRSRQVVVAMPLYPYSPTEQLLRLPGSPPHAPFRKGYPVLGTDYDGRDVLSQLLYGFRISLAFGVGVTLLGTLIGIPIGAAMGFYGGWFDILTQRLIDIWSSIPFLFTMMIVASVLQPGFWSLALMLVVLLGWLDITFYIRGEFYREKSRDYVQAARALGLSDLTIMLRHILPNALVPVVTFLPFDVVGYMAALVSLDYLGFGLPPGTPSWGALLRQGAENIVNHPHLIYIPVLAFAGTLLCVVLIGEAVREAFDPKKFARLR